MWTPVLFHVALSAFVIVSCQQPVGDLSEISSYIPNAETFDKNLLHQCESFAQNLSIENKRLINEIDALSLKLEAVVQRLGEEEEEDDDEDEDENDGNNESEEYSRGLRSRRGTRCDGGTLSAWACAPQCVFKLKGLCGLSLKNICHC